MTFEPSPVGHRVERDGWTLVFVRDLKHPRARVWEALTDPDHLDAWSPFRPDRDLGSTGPATLTMVDGAQEVDTATSVEKADPPNLLEYRWGDDLLRWELAETDDGTRLTLRHTVQARNMMPKVAAGWHLCLDVADRLLAGDPVPVIRGAEAKNHGWQELADAYAAKLNVGEDG